MGNAERRTRPVAITLTAAALTAVSLAGCGSQQSSLFEDGEKVEVGAKSDQPGTSYSPHDGEFNGFDVTVAKEVLAAVDVKSPDFEGVLSQNRARALQNGEVDLMAATYSITETRMAPKEDDGDNLDFVGPYASTKQGVLVRAEDAKRYRNLDDLQGKLVCVWKGTTSATELEKKDYDGIGTSELTDARDCVRELVAKKVDAISTDQLILYGFMDSDPRLKVAPGITFGAYNDYGIAMYKGHREDCEKLKAALLEYVNGNDWDRDFQINLPKVPKADRDEAKPQEGEIESSSCRDKPGSAMTEN